jgi:hypothetical protein
MLSDGGHVVSEIDLRTIAPEAVRVDRVDVGRSTNLVAVWTSKDTMQGPTHYRVVDGSTGDVLSSGDALRSVDHPTVVFGTESFAVLSRVRSGMLTLTELAPYVVSVSRERSELPARLYRRIAAVPDGFLAWSHDADCCASAVAVVAIEPCATPPSQIERLSSNGGLLWSRPFDQTCPPATVFVSPEGVVALYQLPGSGGPNHTTKLEFWGLEGQLVTVKTVTLDGNLTFLDDPLNLWVVAKADRESVLYQVSIDDPGIARVATWEPTADGVVTEVHRAAGQTQIWIVGVLHGTRWIGAVESGGVQRLQPLPAHWRGALHQNVGVDGVFTYDESQDAIVAIAVKDGSAEGHSR